MNKIYENYNVLRWLEKLLNEKLGNKWLLEFKDKKLILNLVNEEGSIIFDNLVFNNTFNNKYLPCSDWNSKLEGFSPPIEDLIPAPGLSKPPKKLIEKNENNYFIHYDIMGLMYFMLTRIEEVNSTEYDQFDRYPSYCSHAFKFNYLDRPIVDEWVLILKQVIKKKWPQIKLKEKEFSINLSHDVDRPFQYLNLSLFNILRFLKKIFKNIFSRKFENLIKNIKDFIDVQKGHLDKDPYNTFDWIMNISEKNGLKSRFNFISINKNKYYDSDYAIESKSIIDLLNEINKRNHYIGLHPNFESYLDAVSIKKQFEILKKVLKKEDIIQNNLSSRMHYLRYKHPKTSILLSEAGILIDESMCYADYAGFRCGSCFEYPAFDPISLKEINLRIRPLIVMDVTITGYMGIDGSENIIKKILDLKNKCKKVKGVFSMLWHNSELVTDNQKKIYNSVIKN